MSGFVNHHVHSHFSTLDGLPSPEDIVNRVAEMGQTSVSLTDHGSLSGIPSMYRAAKKAGISLTPGCEMYFAPDRTYKHNDRLGEKYYHQILLAYNNTGYQNLVKMQTTAWDDGFFHKPRIDWEVLEEFNEGLIATTSCLGGLANQHLLRGDMESAQESLGRLVDIFGKDNVFVEMQNHGIEEQTRILGDQVALAEWAGVGLLASCDSHYCCEGEHDLHDSLLCTSTSATKEQERRFRFDSDRFFLHSAEQMYDLFPEDKFPGAVSNTVEIAERNEFEMKIGDDREYIMPSVETPKGMTEADTLRHNVLEGAKSPNRYGDENGNIPDHVIERIDYELSVVENMGFSGYFLIVENIVKLFAENDIIVGPGRGSAPGAVIVYCLGITDMDPFAHELYFERFLNPDRISMPDIDIDVPKNKRKEALLIIEEEYGKGHVAHLSNYNTMAVRDALTRSSKVFGLAPSQANKVSSVIAPYLEGHQVSLDELVSGEHVLPTSVRRELPITDKMNDIIRTAAAFNGTMFAQGIHACGILITKEPIDDHFPLRRGKGAILPVCQFDGADVEDLGGIKMDILGLKNLDECENAERNILLDLGEEVDSSRIPLDDPKVYDLLSTGESGGIFQLGCLSGTTIIDGERLDELYQRRHSTSFPSQIRSVFLGEGQVKGNTVLDVVHTGRKPLSVIWTATGQKLEATRDHKIFTKRGWKEVGDLIPGEDQVVSVERRVGVDDRRGTVRAREDIIDFFEKHVNGITRINTRDEDPIHIGEKMTLYPTFSIDSNPRGWVFIHPDHSYNHANKLREVGDRNGFTIATFSYSQVIEMLYDMGVMNNTVLPIGTRWTKIVSVDHDMFTENTYDIKMMSPVNNYIANDIMVHNSGGMQKLIRRMKPNKFEDISALLALYRPGPMGMGTHNSYSDRKNGEEKTEVPHEDMNDILSGTYGLIVYQEDVMSLARHYGDYTGAEADDLRKATAKKIPAMMVEHEKKFIPNVNKRYGQKLGKTLWDAILPFSEYGFCKAHAVAYGKTTFRTAWLKAHYPAQFSAAVIDDSLSNKDDLIETIAWTKRLGITVKPPSVLHSELRSVTTKDEVILPITIVSGLGDNVAKNIVEERKEGEFESVIDFMARTKVPASLTVKLAKAGFFDDFGVSRAGVVAEIDQITSLAKTKQSRSTVTSGLFGSIIEEDDDTELIDLVTEPQQVVDGENVVNVDEDLYAKWERESISVILGHHPFQTIREMVVARNMLRQYPPVDTYRRENDKAKFSGVISDITNRVSKRGNDFCSFSLETERGAVDSVAFSHIPEELEGSVILAEGKMENNNEGSDGEFAPHAVCFNIKKVNVNALKSKENELSKKE